MSTALAMQRRHAKVILTGLLNIHINQSLKRRIKRTEQVEAHLPGGHGV